MITVPRESNEFIPVAVKVDGTPVTTFQIQVLPYGQRPIGTWSAPTVVGAQRGLMTGGVTPGTHVVWAKVTDNPEIPVVNCGMFTVT